MMSGGQRGRFGTLIERADKLIGSYNAAPFYYDVVFRIASTWGVSCFNYGYSPVSPEVAADRTIGEPFQIEMYRQAARAVGLDKFKGASVLEISCGLGGGLSHLNQSLGIAMPVALDRAGGGVRSASTRFKLPTVKADAIALPLASGSMDVVVNVEASHVYFEDAFLREVARVLKPTGTLVLIDSRDLTPADAETYLRSNLARVGLALRSFRDITQNVVDSCVADTPRRETLLKRVPFFVRPSLRPMLGVEGSTRYECFRRRKTTYFISTFSAAAPPS
jgi:SAM-dependent methyltransferase